MTRNNWQPLKRHLEASLSELPHSIVEKLSIVECAFLLDVLPVRVELAVFRRRLARQVVCFAPPSTLRHQFARILALWNYEKALLSDKQFSMAIQTLLSAEVAVGGPYHENDHVQVGTNLVIARSLALLAKPLPNLETFFAGIVRSKRLSDREMPESVMIYWLLKVYKSRELHRYVTRRSRQTSWQTVENQIATLAVLGRQLPQNVFEERLAALCKNAVHTLPGGQLHSAAMLLDIIDWHEKRLGIHRHSMKQCQAAVVALAQPIFAARQEPLRSGGLEALHQLTKADNDFEISLLPHIFAHSMKVPFRSSEHFCDTLGAANICTWLAYTIFDDFLDEEAQAAQLPIATVAMRAACDFLQRALPAQPAFWQHAASVFTSVDEACAWEVASCRFQRHGPEVTMAALPHYGNYQVLAARSLAHTLGPVGLARAAGCNARALASIETGLRYYLIARQLNDDLHDWVKDIQAGQVSAVVSAILKDMHIAPGAYQLEPLLAGMRRCFREQTLSRMCRVITKNTTSAKRLLRASGVIYPNADFFYFIDKIEASAQTALNAQAKSRAIMQMFQPHT